MAQTIAPTLADSWTGTLSTGGTSSYSTARTTALGAGVYMVNAYIKHYTAPSGDPDPGELRLVVPGLSQDAFPWKVTVLEDDSAYESYQESNNLWVTFKLSSATTISLEQRTVDPDAGGIGTRLFYSCWKISDV